MGEDSVLQKRREFMQVALKAQPRSWLLPRGRTSNREVRTAEDEEEILHRNRN